MENKILIAFFSAGGATKQLAKKLAEASGNADLYEIKPEVPYTKKDLDWTDGNSRSTVEMHNLDYRPPIADKEVDISRYDMVLIGFPIWWHKAPTVINTFLEKYDFSGKRIALFATSGGSGMDESMIYLKDSVSDTAVFTGERRFRGTESREELARWIESVK